MNKLLTVCASLAIITCGSVSAQKKGEVSIGGIIVLADLLDVGEGIAQSQEADGEGEMGSRAELERA